MIIDSHIHIARELTGFWKPLRYGKIHDEGETRQFLPPSFDPPASPPEMALGFMDEAGVDRAIVVQHHLWGDHNATLLDSLKRWPDRFVGFAYLGPLDQPGAPDELERLIEAGMTGLKVELYSTRRLRPTFRFDGDPEWLVWERLNSLKRPLILDINNATPEDVTALRGVLDKLDNVRFVICHVGWPAWEGWEERALLAKHPRGWTDLASLTSMFLHTQEYPYPIGQQHAKWAVETFGSDRVMWGTDYPGILNYGTYRQHVDWVRKHCEFLTDEQRQCLLGGAAEKFLEEVGQ
jgi:predicted TIM-barrel fold metal-dependent hydrolase